ncbi:MAG: RNA pseudouridine synthase [Desulfovibrionaceae bacterium]|nr:RNA pseudouridine synthase [Desulfovibrionaceae bacterium]
MNLPDGTYKITPELDGKRLDAALAALLPGFSQREARRLWETFLFKLNSRPARKGMKVRSGDMIEIVPLSEPDTDAGAVLSAVRTAPLRTSLRTEKRASSGSVQTYPPDKILKEAASAFPEPDLSLLRVLKSENDILGIFKPAGLHSAALPGGRGGLSLEDMLPDLCEKSGIDPVGTVLFNRLDCLTSGIVMACRGEAALKRCLDAENAGLMEKRYFALVCGDVTGELIIANKLDTDSRARTKVLKQAEPDPLRHTRAEPLYSAPAGEFGLEIPADIADIPTSVNIAQTNPVCTLLQVVIKRGARHQIRAHLAAAGYPIWGDPIYNDCFSENCNLYLHHFAVSAPDFLCLAAPVWGQTATQMINGLFPGLFHPINSD